MKMVADTVQDYSIGAAQSFIQTAVFVDDKIYARQSVGAEESRTPTVPRPRKKVLKTASQEKSGGASSGSAATEDAPPDTCDIVTSFAKKQIVCSLYQPKSSDSVSRSSNIFPLCKSADVVIIDWDLFGDRGTRALTLIDGLIIQAVQDVPEQLRLILVYTQEGNLRSVADEIYEKVHPNVGDNFEPLPEEDGLAFHTSNSRISIKGKPGLARADTDACHVVEEAALADAAVNEFAKLASGILHAATLLGLAEIRKNSRKIISKFGKDLDPAFLTHFAMGLPEEDASAHIIPLLLSEIGAVLEDALPSPLMPKEMLNDWCANVWKPGGHLDEMFSATDSDHRVIAEDICTLGFDDARGKHSSVPNLKNPVNVRKAAKILLPSDESDANHRFSHLMASRTFYGEKDKELKLGSVLQHGVKDSYFLCIQPVCDSVRLTESRAFVFVRLKQAEPGSQVSHVVIKPDDSVLELMYTPKSYRCFTATFSPDRSLQKVVAKKDGAQRYCFEDVDKNKFYWIDQLRASHAQRAVERFASDLSRVGLTESEWLRRLEKK